MIVKLCFNKPVVYRVVVMFRCEFKILAFVFQPHARNLQMYRDVDYALRDIRIVGEEYKHFVRNHVRLL